MNIKNLADSKKFKQMMILGLFSFVFLLHIPFRNHKENPSSLLSEGAGETKNKLDVREDNNHLLEIKTCSLPDHQKYHAGVHVW